MKPLRGIPRTALCPGCNHPIREHALDVNTILVQCSGGKCECERRRRELRVDWVNRRDAAKKELEKQKRLAERATRLREKVIRPNGRPRALGREVKVRLPEDIIRDLHYFGGERSETIRNIVTAFIRDKMNELVCAMCRNELRQGMGYRARTDEAVDPQVVV